MTPQQARWNDWMTARQDADDMNAIAAALAGLIAAADPATLTRAENALYIDEHITIGYLHDPE